MPEIPTECPSSLELVNTRRIMSKVTKDIARFLAEPFSAGEEPVKREVVSQLIKDYLEAMAEKKLFISFEPCIHSIVGYRLHYPNKRDHFPRVVLLTNEGTVRPSNWRFYGRRTARVYGKRSIGNVVADVFLQPIVPVNRITLNVVITKPETVDETPVG
jgi:hypothetical protein